MKNITTLIVFLLCSLLLPAQALVGTTGLLSLPSADMQKDGTVTAGGTCLNQHLIPDRFNYQTYNYYFNATVLSFLEVSFSKTLFRLVLPDYPESSGKFNNADRSLSARVRVLSESPRFPAILIGMNDIYSQVSDEFMDDENTNQFFGKMYVALRKSFSIETYGTVEGHLVYQYQSTFDNVLYKGWGGAIAFRPSIFPDLQFITEYDVSKHTWNNGFNADLFNHLFAQVILQNGKYLSGGIALRIHLQPLNK